jgi:2-iminobutanoate/2-iminopropanoate deaminase
MHDKRIVRTDSAPEALGPYSQAVVCAGWVFCSGQIPLDPATGEIVQGDVAKQTRRVLANLEAVLAAAQSDLSQVVQTTVYLKDLGDFAAMNEEYARHFPSEAPPARATVEVARLPKDVKVEIACVARVAGAAVGAAEAGTIQDL